MKFNEISFARLQAQQVSAHTIKKPGELVKYLGAVQSQDFAMALWALGARLPGSSQKTILNAINKGQILRTHVLRPTWHFVSPDDIGWMIDLTARSLRSAMGSMDKHLGLNPKIFSRVNSLVEKSLSENGPMTRDEIMEMLHQHKIDSAQNRSSHLLFGAEIEKLICSGPMKGNKITYTLFSQQVKKSETLTREEALARLALKYFSSHCPATIKDFSWWGGINFGDARKGVEAIKDKLIEEKIGTESYWLPHNFKLSPVKDHVYLLPAYDEFTISYKDRTPSLADAHRSRIISSNGIFNPLIIIDGRVAGMWKRQTVKDTVTVKLDLFSRPGKKTEALVWEEAEKYAAFNGKKLARG